MTKTSRLKQISFASLYGEAKEQPTPAQQFIQEVAELTKRSENTVRMWIWGRQIPDALTCRVIGLRYGVDPDTLFPNSNPQTEEA